MEKRSRNLTLLHENLNRGMRCGVVMYRWMLSGFVAESFSLFTAAVLHKSLARLSTIEKIGKRGMCIAINNHNQKCTSRALLLPMALFLLSEVSHTHRLMNLTLSQV